MATTETRSLCSTPPRRPPALPPGLPDGRQRAIINASSKWVNGTTLHYWFFDEHPDPAWVGPAEQQDVVRAAFEEWKDVGIGLDFEEVDDRAEAEVRIAFLQTDGSWSYVGRDILGIGASEPTMNFGWDLTTPYGHGTARHEIGHTLGLPHEHQNPFSGIVWDEDKVYASLGGPPNNWPRQQTFDNILRKLSTAEVEGSPWDPNSIMEYEFEAGLIVEPAQYHQGLFPPGTISDTDKEWVLRWYPGDKAAAVKLEPFKSHALSLKSTEQADFAITPPESREYTLSAFGSADSVLVLFEEVDGQLRYLAGDDDSGSERRGTLTAKLLKGRRYVLKVRLYWVGTSGETAVMYW